MANSKKGTKQVNPPTPKAKVNQAFGGKKGLVDALVSLLGDAPEGTRGKLMQTSNTKLLSHHHNTQRMAKDFGSKDGLITAILAERFPKGAPDGERARLEGFTPWRLMDHHRQVASKAATDRAAQAKAAAAKAAGNKKTTAKAAAGKARAGKAAAAKKK